MEDEAPRVLTEDNPGDARLIRRTPRISPNHGVVSDDRLDSGLAHLARLGDDGFAILIEGVATPQDGAVVAHESQNTPSKCLVMGGQQPLLGTRIRLYPADGEHGEALFIHADIALCRAKGQRNRNGFCGDGGER